MKKDGGGGGDGGGKKEEDVVEVKVDMHCVGCARKVKRAVKGLHGVERVKVDSANSKMKVVGTVDPWTLKEFLEAYTKKKVDFVSPKDAPKKKPDAAAAAGDAKKPAARKKEENESEDNTKPPRVSTVRLKIPLHCEGCVYRIRKAIYKIKEVDEVTVDKEKDLVIVNGTMDRNSLPPYLKEKLNIDAVIEELKKESKEDGEKKEKENGGDGGAGGGGEKKEKEKNSDEGGGKKGGEGGEKEAVASSSSAGAAEVNKYEYYEGYGYRVEKTHPTQLFSDENPNACSTM